MFWRKNKKQHVNNNDIKLINMLECYYCFDIDGAKYVVIGKTLDGHNIKKEFESIDYLLNFLISNNNWKKITIEKKPAK